MTASKKPESKAPETMQCLLIKSTSQRGFRRCGFGFTAQGAYYDKALFNEAQIKTLKAERNLVVTEAEIDTSELEGPFFGVEGVK